MNCQSCLGEATVHLLLFVMLIPQEQKLAASNDSFLQPTILTVILVWLPMPHAQQAGLLCQR